jgi:hypothetical protein
VNKVFIGIVILLIVAGGAYYFLKNNGSNLSYNYATSSPTATKTPVAGESSSPTTASSENDLLIAAVKAGLITEHGQDAASLNVTVSTIEGNYAKGMASEQGGGGLWFAAKVNGNWNLVWDGNGIISCSVLTPYPNFPNSMIPECFDQTSNNLVTR